ncbi:MAG TPA: hypothetical protein VK797_23065 [Tepidisphaeraceae bacterium]|jgi:hypothetical protein|nr:hypothetical protein [Tepidisphaeraceae bacterium]
MARMSWKKKKIKLNETFRHDDGRILSIVHSVTLEGDESAIAEFIDRFDVEPPLDPDRHQRWERVHGESHVQTMPLPLPPLPPAPENVVIREGTDRPMRKS